MFIVLTQVDKKTKQPCTSAVMVNGSGFPAVGNFSLDFFNTSQHPIETDAAGVYLTAPEYYGTCDDDSFTGFPGVLEVIEDEEITPAVMEGDVEITPAVILSAEEKFNTRKRDEFYARNHSVQAVFDENTLVWVEPVSEIV